MHNNINCELFPCNYKKCEVLKKYWKLNAYRKRQSHKQRNPTQQAQYYKARGRPSGGEKFADAVAG